ncbi:DedA family protein [Pseudarthrobacter sp. Y6]|uniref:DedA family protein n=1 Tax=Pseudarthrobacter sp. Y6 TaxID=3418422 RepID=UPI003CEB34CB
MVRPAWQQSGFLGRRVPVFRSLISIPAGIDRMPLWRFLGLTVAGSLIWNSVLILAGYFLGSNWQLVADGPGADAADRAGVGCPHGERTDHPHCPGTARRARDACFQPQQGALAGAGSDQAGPRTLHSGCGRGVHCRER